MAQTMSPRNEAADRTGNVADALADAEGTDPGMGSEVCVHGFEELEIGGNNEVISNAESGQIDENDIRAMQKTPFNHC